ncbi:MAG: hypothetical protein ALAOOOJD_02068 [bacterium]|nr:hypothetical protein [bacterium]
MAVGAVDRDRMIRRDFVDHLARWQHAVEGALVIPVALRDPATGREFIGIRFQFIQKRLLVFAIAQIDGDQALAAGDEVRVRIGKAGNDTLAAGIDHAGVFADIFFNLHGAAGGDDLFIAHGQRFRFGLPFIHRPNFGILDNKIGRLLARASGRDH